MMALEGDRQAWLAALADELYGPIPPAPRHMAVRREPLPDRHAERLVLDLDGFSVDACLWRPETSQGLKGIIAGLDFTGPIGTLASEAFPLDGHAIVALPAWRGGGHGPLDDALRGSAMHRVPVELILSAGWGVLTSCYGSWVPDDPDRWGGHGLVPRLGRDAGPGGRTRAVSLWAWALQRLVDVAERLGSRRTALAGHSRLGKAALWAAATDTRVTAVLGNDTGCGGASLEAHGSPGGETLAHLRERFPHWVLPDGPRTTDQHHLLASIAPRGLYVASAAADLWGDPEGEVLALQAAAPAWGEALADQAMTPGAALVQGRIGWHLRPGGHEILPYDWRRYLAFLDGLPA